MIKHRFRYQRKNDQKLFPLVLIGSSTVAALISIVIGLRQSVWFDEAYSIMLAKHPVAELVGLAAADTHPPLYYLLLKGWSGVFGWSEFALRSLSVVALFGAILVMGLLIRKMFGARVAIGTLMLLMIAPMLLRYGFEIRMYAVASFIGVLASYALYSALHTRLKRRRMLLLAAYGALLALGMYTLYYLAFLWIAHLVWLLVLLQQQKDKKQYVREFATVYIGASALFLPWLPTFIQQIGNGALAPIGQPMNLENMLGIISFNTLYQPLWQLGVIGSVYIIGVLVSMGIVVRFAVKQKYKLNELKFLAAYMVVPVLILIVVSLGRDMYVERYLAHVSIGLVAVVGVLVSFALSNKEFPRTLALGIAVIIYGGAFVGMTQVAAVGNMNFQRLQTPTVKQISSNISDCNSEQLVAADPYVAIELAYYLPECDVYFVSSYDTLSGGYTPLAGSTFQLHSLSEVTKQKINYVYYGDEPVTPKGYRQNKKIIEGPLNLLRFSAE